MELADLLASVRAALGRDLGASTPAPPASPAFAVPAPVTDRAALVDRFCERAAAVGVEIRRVAEAELDATLAALGASRAPLVDGAAAYDREVGLTDAAWAIAETGSVVVAAAPDAPRGLSAATLVHVAVVREADVVQTLAEALARGAEGGLPSALTVVTGPSKTADIEGIIVTGVHGPGRVVAVVVSPGAGATRAG
ncbi:MAG: LUD domain-containing protein [Myxococcales bacterium]|nr:LUD domain-containing protein [Myxococcales bacterium]MCB9734147.1 LUD domain-containing protein [Deltaproteobacteria bacterium]